MQTRHQDRSAYFEETATSCRNYYLPYIEQHTSLKFGRKCRVMEVGCGIGGILSIFAAMGATVTGIDIHKPSIETAKIQNTAPGPPIAIAPATPAILPVPTVAASAVQTA